MNQIYQNESKVHSIGFSPDGRYLVSELPMDNCETSKLVIWDTSTSAKVAEIPTSGWSSPFEFSLDSKWLAVADNECEPNSSDIIIWDFENLITIGSISVSYTTRDLAAAKERYNKYKFDKMFYEVGAEQKLHFKQFFKILDLLGYKWAKNLVHIDHGLYLGKDGKRLATRKGKTI